MRRGCRRGVPGMRVEAVFPARGGPGSARPTRVASRSLRVSVGACLPERGTRGKRGTPQVRGMFLIPRSTSGTWNGTWNGRGTGLWRGRGRGRRPVLGGALWARTRWTSRRPGLQTSAIKNARGGAPGARPWGAPAGPRSREIEGHGMALRPPVMRSEGHRGILQMSFAVRNGV